ncbi:MAG: S41 family peptidase, partial [Gammaproteobacteria bacterium]|nr:S41 family peptidase [Gammaproteobacteria bacterium]
MTSIARLITILFLYFNFLFPVIAENQQSESQGIPHKQLRNFTDIFSRIKSDYVEHVDDKTLLENAIRGMLSGLDPHSTYFDPDEYKEFNIGTTGQFGGLGIKVGMENGFVKVISPIDDTPAFNAGIKAGDLIIRINDTPVKGLSLNDAVNLMRGKPGTEVTLIILRDNENNPLTFNLKRDNIKVKSIKSHLLEKDYGYIRITTFQARTYKHLKQALTDLLDENKRALKGIVLDLRNNPG